MFNMLESLPRCVEYSDPRFDEYKGRARIVEESQGVSFTHRRAGYYIAGSAARLENETWGYQFEFEGAKHGRRYACEREAREAFARIVRARGGAT